jgi:hypothetical protein
MKQNLEPPKEVYELLETWKYGKASAFYDFPRNEIHVLRGKALEERALIHEHFHANRRDKITFQLGALMTVPQVINLFFGIFIVLGAFGVGALFLNSANWLMLAPCFFVAGLFTVLLGCLAYEELLADQAVQQSCREIKRNGATP